MISAWLTAGVLDRGRFAPTERGSPQGGVISPLLLNVALHGMEQAAGVRYYPGAPTRETVRGAPVLVRYADDLLALCHTQAQAEQVKARLAAWLAPRGLAFNDDKTAIRHLDAEGCDFLGYSIRRYRGKLLIKPSTAAMRRIRKRLTVEVRALRGANALAVIAALNPIIRGWAAYYRNVVSSRAFAQLDDHLWRLTYKWACHSHANKPRHWVTARYFGRFHPSRQDRWVFGDRDSGACLAKFSWTRIVRHTLVNADASPDDPTLAEYWAQRRRRSPPRLDRATLRQLVEQQGRCPICQGLLLHADDEPHNLDQWQQWFTVIRKAIRHQAILADADSNLDDTVAPRLIHAHCRQRAPAPTKHRRTPHPPSRLA
jgi:RNA-directed DNA polymerase